jgi:DNA-binding MarR family transcriptional regulator
MNAVLRIQAALAQAGKGMTASELSAASGFGSVDLGRHIAQMVQYGSATREKKEDGRRNLYYLTVEQLRRFHERVHELRWVLQVADGKAASFCLPTDTDDIHDRLKFLRMLKDRTVYSDHAALALIIQDYERTLRLRRKCEGRAETEETRGRKPYLGKAMEGRANGI